MKRALCLCLILASIASAAVPAGTVWELRATGDKVNGGGFVWQSFVSASFTWTKSSADGGTRHEYYCKKGAGTCMSAKPGSVTCDGNFNLATEGSLVAGLEVGQWDWGDNDSLGFDTIYVRLTDNTDPDSKVAGFVSASLGTDYSQQNAAQTSATDICIVRGDTTQIYRSGATKWAAADVNNIIHITAGTGFTAGWYHITAVDANSDAVCDAAVGTAGSVNGTGAIGGAVKMGDTTVDSELPNKAVAGNHIYQSGDWTFTESVSTTSRDGTTTAPIWWTGYNKTRGDTCVGDDMPDWTQGAYYFSSGDVWQMANIDAVGDGSSGVWAIGDFARAYNCKLLMNSGTASRVAIATTSQCILSHCNISSTNGTAISQTGTANRILHCFIHDSTTGASNANTLVAVGNVFYNCTSALPLSTSTVQTVIGNTFRSCATAISHNQVSFCIENNIFDDCSTAEINATTDYYGWLAFNCFGEALPTLTNMSIGMGPGNLYADPGLVNPAGGDFTVPTGSVVIDAGAQVGTDQGLAGDYDNNIGADQGDHPVVTTSVIQTPKPQVIQ